MVESSTNPLEQIKEIKKMMEQSSRFISLSGWSGIGAGLSALAGAYLANVKIKTYYNQDYHRGDAHPQDLFMDLVWIALVVFMCAAFCAIFFTYRTSRKQGIPLWGEVSKRLLWNTLLPMMAGGIFILKMVEDKCYDYVPGACLLFYGLGLINGSKFTLGEVRFLGYAQMLVGLISLFFVRDGLWFWAMGFGVFHIIYGIVMWKKYEQND